MCSLGAIETSPQPLAKKILAPNPLPPTPTPEPWEGSGRICVRTTLLTTPASSSPFVSSLPLTVPRPTCPVGQIMHCKNLEGAIGTVTWVVPLRHLHNLPTVYRCPGHLMAMARKVAFLPPQALPNLDKDSCLCLSVLMWPRSDLPLTLIGKYLPNGPSPRGLWNSIYKSEMCLGTLQLLIFAK